MISDILQKSKDEKKLIGIWIYGDSDGFWSGYVQDFNDEFVVLKHFTKYGKPDGVLIEKIDNIECVDFDDNYLNGLEYLIRNSEKLDKDPTTNIELSNTENWQYEILEEFVGDRNNIVRIQINNDNYYSGLVTWIDYDSLVLNLLGNEGEENGSCFFKLEDVTMIRINDIANRKKLLLNKRKKPTGNNV